MGTCDSALLAFRGHYRCAYCDYVIERQGCGHSRSECIDNVRALSRMVYHPATHAHIDQIRLARACAELMQQNEFADAFNDEFSPHHEGPPADQ